MVLVCVTDQESCSRLIRTGRRLANLLGSPLKVITVRPKGSENWFASDELEYLYQVSKELGAEMIIRFHNDASQCVADYIAQQPIQSIVVGEPPEPGHSLFISNLESRHPQLPLLTVDAHGNAQLASVFHGVDEPAAWT